MPNISDQLESDFIIKHFLAEDDDAAGAFTLPAIGARVCILYANSPIIINDY